MSFERDVNNFPASWRGIVEKWSEFNAQYYDQNSDLPAWYVENSNSALFSAAAWVEGHQALCEVDVDKKIYPGTPGRPASYPGRMDIELIVDEKIYWVEAKRRAFTLSRESNYSFRHAFLATSGSVPGFGVTLIFGLGWAAVTGRRFSPGPWVKCRKWRRRFPVSCSAA